MTVAAALSLLKTFGPWVAVALVLAYLGALQLDRNHLAALNRTHGECLASVQAKPGSKPIGTVCETPIATAVATATAADACTDQLTRYPDGVPSICARPIQTLAAARNAAVATSGDLRQQLDHAQKDQADAVARATARATANAQRTAHAAQVLDAQPHDASGRTVCDARCLRDLSGPPADL